MRRKLVFLAIVLGIVGAFAFGFIDRDQVARWAAHFYLVGRHEVAQISAANPPAGATEAARICRQNLDRIQAAKRRIAESRGTAVGAVTWEEVLAVMYPEKARRGITPALVQELMPRCPAGGTYTLGNLQDLARCSIGTNNNMDPADDHIIRR
jgi:hypothetical protein